MLILADALIQAPDRVLRPGHLRISGQTIDSVGTDLHPQVGEEVLRLPGITLAPGFLNLHAHLELAPLHGKIPRGLPFAEWLRQILSLLPGLHSTARTASILEASRSAAESGTTTLLNILSDPESLAGLAGTLPRVWWAQEFMDLHGNPPLEDQMDRMAAWLSRHPAMAWKSALSPHAPYTASSSLYRECGCLASHLHIPLTTHWAESSEEAELFQSGAGALRPLLPDSWLPGRLSDRLQGIPSGSLIAHANLLSDCDLKIFAQKGFSVVHCPTSHAWFGREPFPLERFRQHQIPVLLGTDSPASSENRSYDLRVEARAFHQAHPEVSLPEIWAMLTTLPAKALGQEGLLGCLQPSAAADWVGWKLNPSADPVSTLLHSTAPAEIVSIAAHLHHPAQI